MAAVGRNRALTTTLLECGDLIGEDRVTLAVRTGAR
jgi:hypothetical protein